MLQRQLRRQEVAKFFAKLAPTRIGMEACGASHHWARVHELVLIPPQYVKAYVQRAARQERRDRRGGDLRGDEPADGASTICPDQDRRATGGADDARSALTC